LIAAYLNICDARQRTFRDDKRDCQILAVNRNALPGGRARFAIAHLAHPRLNRSLIPFEQFSARVTAAVTQERDEAEGGRLLRA
jgi:hypothetical protein